MKIPFLKDETGKESATLTAGVVSLTVVLAKLLVAGVVVDKVNLGPPPDGAVVAALLASTWGAYVVRRGQDGKVAP